MQVEVSNALTNGIIELIKRRYPYTPKFSHSYQEEMVIKSKVAKWRFVVLILMIIFMVGLTMLYALLMHLLYSYALHAMIPHPDTLYLYSWEVFCFPGIFLALGTFSFPLEAVERLLMEEKYEVYNDYYHTQEGYDGTKVAHLMLRLFSIISLIVLLPFCTSFISVNTRNLTVKQFYQLSPKTFQLSSIKKIDYDTASVDKKNTICYRPHYQLFLKEGNHINTMHWAYDDSVVTVLVTQLNKNGVALDSGGISKREGNWFSLLQSDE